MTRSLYPLTDDTDWFPNPTLALDEPPGLLAIGGDLSPERLLAAYQRGIFPWFNEGEPILWWSPNPRACIDPAKIRVNKSLKKFLNRCDYRMSINQAFDQVIEACAEPRGDQGDTWILPPMQAGYSSLHKKGHAHSIEIWQGDDLVGGLYGVLVGSAFCGESMFSTKSNASKLALLTLGYLLANKASSFIDCQLPNPYLMSMGASLMSRDVFLEKLHFAVKYDLPKSIFSPRFIERQPIVEHYVNG